MYLNALIQIYSNCTQNLYSFFVRLRMLIISIHSTTVHALISPQKHPHRGSWALGLWCQHAGQPCSSGLPSDEAIYCSTRPPETSPLCLTPPSIISEVCWRKGSQECECKDGPEIKWGIDSPCFSHFNLNWFFVLSLFGFMITKKFQH